MAVIMFRTGWALGQLGALLAAGTLLAAPAPLKLYTEDLPPFSSLGPDGRIGGSSTQKVEAILRDAGVSYVLALTSWARALETARTQPACVFSTARIPERENAFQWIGPLAHMEGILYGLAGHTPAATTLESAQGARIGGYHGSASTQYLIRRGYNVILSANHTISLRNLLAGRLDFWLANRDSGNALIAREGAVGKVVPMIPVVNLELYLACNPGVDPTVIKRMQQSFTRLQSQGRFSAIDRRHDN